jgi:hypothetical protein
MLGKILVNRFFDPKTGEIQYLCEGGTQCVQSVKDSVIRDKAEALQTFKVNNTITGEPYGFLVPKNGDFVFKTAEPPYEGGKLGRGKECGNVSTMTGHIADLIQIGDILKAAGKTDFDLNNGVLLGGRKIKNATRACTLLDMLIRYLDADKIQNKKWFFRPLLAFYTKHKGVFKPVKK